MIYCRKCGVANPPDANYCYNDGYPLEHNAYPPSISSKSRESCFQCGAWRHGHALYCHICGETFEQLDKQIFTSKRATLKFKRDNRQEMVRSFLLTIPFAIISMIIMIMIVTLSADELEDNTNQLSISSASVSDELIRYNNYFETNISRIRQVNQNVDAESAQTYLTWQENVLLSHGITFEQKESEDMSELNNGSESYTMDLKVQNSKPQYMFLLVLLTGISAIIYRRFRPRISLFSMSISAISFALVYLLPVAILTIFVSDSLMREFNNGLNREVSFQFVVDGTFIVLGLLLTAVFFVAQLWREKRSLPYVLNGVKLGSYWLVLILSLFYVGSSIIVAILGQSVGYIHVLMNENEFVSLGLIAGFLTIFLVNTGLLNTLNINTVMLEDTKLVYHLFNQSISEGEGQTVSDQAMQTFEQYASPLVQLTPWAWFSFLILMLACLLIGTYIKTNTLVAKIKLATGIALVFSIVNSLFVMIMSQRMEQVFNDRENINFVNYDLLMTMVVTFGFVMAFVMSGIALKYLWKGANTNESNHT